MREIVTKAERREDRELGGPALSRYVGHGHEPVIDPQHIIPLGRAWRGSTAPAQSLPE
jgi:hypothetical protein